MPHSQYKGAPSRAVLSLECSALATESLLHMLQQCLMSLALPTAAALAAGPTVKVVMYADDMTVSMSSEGDVQSPTECQWAYEHTSSACTNWAKKAHFSWVSGPMPRPQTCPEARPSARMVSKP